MFRKMVAVVLITVIACIPASSVCAASTTTSTVETTETTGTTTYGETNIQLVILAGRWAEVLPIKIVIGGRWVSIPMSCYGYSCRGEIQIAPGDYQVVILNHDAWVIWKMVLRAYGPRRTVRWISVPGVRWFEVGSVIPSCQIGCYNAGVAGGCLFCVPTDPASPPSGGCRLGGGGGGSQWWIIP